MGQWEREAKAADYKAVIRLSEEALLKTTKDLWVAAWLTEAWIYEFDLPGFTSGLQLVRGLLKDFWPHLYPELEDGDAELRASPLEWIGSYFDPSKGSSPIMALRKVPLTQGGLHWFTYQESRRIGSEAEVRGNDVRTKARDAAIKEGKVSIEIFDKDFEATPKAFYKDLDRDSKILAETLLALDEDCRELFGEVAPSFNPLHKALGEFSNVIHILLLRKLEKEPDVVAPAPQIAELVPDTPESAAAPVQAETIAPLDLSQLRGGEITSTEAAVLHVVAAAQYLRRTTPAHPSSYLLLRAQRWGELRSLPTESATQNLPAPPTAVRVALRAAAAGNNYKEVLEIAESTMGTVVGRGWLDLQRYSIIACDKLGYAAAAKALRSDLKAFLHDFPQLHLATLSDDTGAANPETLAWLRTEGYIT